MPLILIGNKSDLIKHRAVQYEEGKRLVEDWRSKGHQASFIETSALTGDVITFIKKKALI